MTRVLTVLLLAKLILYVESFYLPGLAPVNFCKKEDESDVCKVSSYYY